jgi:hypothetical protein
MAHTQAVSDVIQKLLRNYSWLKLLVDEAKKSTATPETVDRVLQSTAGLTLKEDDQKEFFWSLKYGVMTMTAASLIDYYEELRRESKGDESILRAKAPPQEWTP